MKKKVKKVPVKLGEISDHYFGISARRYRQLATLEVVPAANDGYIDFVESAAALIKYYQGNSIGREVSFTDEKQRKTKIEADHKQLKLDKEKNKLIETAVASQLWAKVVMSVRQKLLNLPMSLARTVYGAESLAVTKDLIEKYIYEILRELSEPTLKNPKK